MCGGVWLCLCRGFAGLDLFWCTGRLTEEPGSGDTSLEDSEEADEEEQSEEKETFAGRATRGRSWRMFMAVATGDGCW